MKFVALIDYTPDQAKILEVRPAHREYLAGVVKAGHLVVGGPFLDDSGGLIIYETETAEDTEKLVREDPFAKQGVFVSWKIRPWKLVMLSPEITPG